MTRVTQPKRAAGRRSGRSGDVKRLLTRGKRLRPLWWRGGPMRQQNAARIGTNQSFNTQRNAKS
jgi:hypothetical protein